MNNLKKCTLCCIQNLRKPINLPHDKSVIIGRSELTGIKDSALSRNQGTPKSLI